MRHRTNHAGAGAAVATLALALTTAGFLAAPAAAAPRQVAGMVTDNDLDSSKGKPRAVTPEGGAQEPASRAPRKPDTPADTSMWAPPLPGYALMFILGGAIVALNLWSSKRVRAD